MKMSPTFKYAFTTTIPIMTEFLFLGITYGIYMRQEGFNFLYPTLMALTIFGGSVEFVVANLLIHSFAPLTVLRITLLVNSRHLFYCISMLDRYKNTGWAKIYLIFGMCDETFSINYTAKLPKSIDKKKFMLYVTLLNHIYWVIGSFLGGFLGLLIIIQLKGITFVMTALFIVLFMNQFLNEQNHFSSYSGLLVAFIALFVVGHNLFLPVTLMIMVFIFSIKRKKGRIK